MKCPVCKGRTVEQVLIDGLVDVVPCKCCGGKGVVEPLTEQEWLQTATTEQLAELITDIRDNDIYANGRILEPLIMKLVGVREKELRKSIIVEWLKQPHTNKAGA